MSSSERKSLAGWGRVGGAECDVLRPASPRDLGALLSSETSTSMIARGMGRSYGDPSVNAGNGVIDCCGLSCLRGFDETSGVVDCEAGVTLRDLIESFLPRGYFLPVTPGTKFVTVGGAIANDVHGKNHHGSGSFGSFVQSLRIMLASGEIRECSPELEPDLFWATVGGIGLTGLILSAKVKLIPVETGYMKVDYLRCADLDTVLAAMKEGDHRYTYSVAWVDCLARGRSLGRSVLMRGDHAVLSELSAGTERLPKSKRSLPVPIDFPGFVLNSLSIAAFNELFYQLHATREKVIVDYDSYFYPLDKLSNWNRMYGRHGFMQYQATFPTGEIAGVIRCLEQLSRTRRASFLAVLKVMGESNPGWLSYPMPGITLNLDLPNKPGTVDFLRGLDRILLDHGGKLYFAKDVCALPETIQAMYPKLDEFRGLKARIDPGGRWSSNLARRLSIVETPIHA